MFIFKAYYNWYLEPLMYINLDEQIRSELLNLVAMEDKHSKSHNTVVHKISIANYSVQSSIYKTTIKFEVNTKSIKNGFSN